MNFKHYSVDGTSLVDLATFKGKITANPPNPPTITCKEMSEVQATETVLNTLNLATVADIEDTVFIKACVDFQFYDMDPCDFKQIFTRNNVNIEKVIKHSKKIKSEDLQEISCITSSSEKQITLQINQFINKYIRYIIVLLRKNSKSIHDTLCESLPPDEILFDREDLYFTYDEQGGGCVNDNETPSNTVPDPERVMLPAEELLNLLISQAAAPTQKLFDVLKNLSNDNSKRTIKNCINKIKVITQDQCVDKIVKESDSNDACLSFTNSGVNAVNQALIIPFDVNVTDCKIYSGFNTSNTNCFKLNISGDLNIDDTIEIFAVHYENYNHNCI